MDIMMVITKMPENAAANNVYKPKCFSKMHKLLNTYIFLQILYNSFLSCMIILVMIRR